jgi:anti-sigma B factor antagonist
MMEHAFDLEEHPQGDSIVVAVSGEIDLATSPTLRGRLDALVEEGRSSLVVDLRRTTFLDSTGLGVLVHALKRCRAAGGDLQLVITEPRILSLFAITGLEETFSILPAPDAHGNGDVAPSE